MSTRLTRLDSCCPLAHPPPGTPPGSRAALQECKQKWPKPCGHGSAVLYVVCVAGGEQRLSYRPVGGLTVGVPVRETADCQH